VADFERKKHAKGKMSSKARHGEGGFSERLPLIQSHAEVSAGKVRKQNEDSVFCLNTLSLAPDLKAAFGLFIVADGMGGHDNGELASSLAVQAVSSSLQQQLFTPMQQGHKVPGAEEVEQAVRAAAQAAQEAVLHGAPGGGTTLSAAVVINNLLCFAHVGDSRIYLYSQKTGLQALTKDHTIVRRLVDLGQISAKDAQSNPLRNQLYRAVGQSEAFRADLGIRELDAACTLLLCSDGLWGLVSEEFLLKTLEKGQSAQASARALVDAANKAGGTDNISVIFVEIK